jgi:hypothetical protein
MSWCHTMGERLDTGASNFFFICIGIFVVCNKIFIYIS